MAYGIILLVVTVVTLVLYISGCIFFSIGISGNRKNYKGDIWAERDSADVKNVLKGPAEKKDILPDLEPYREEIEAANKWTRSRGNLLDYEITSFDDLKLRAKFIPCENMKGIIIMMHGFRSNPIHDFSCAFKYYHDMGYACLVPWQRAHGESEGKYIYYGDRERFDVRDWALLMEKEYPKHSVILDGISMGASTVLMASGLELPSNVKGIIADCGYTSPYSIFVEVLKKGFHLPAFPLINVTQILARIRADFDFKGCSTTEALKNNKLPVLIAHGEADGFVPHPMGVENYETAKEY